jgi:hypothetical protein
MDTRMRSPNYPSMPISQAIALAGKVFATERTNGVDRAVAAQAMGFSGITGRSAKVLSDLIQYGLLEKAGKNEVRVSPLAMNVLLPDNADQRASALRESASKPELFQRIAERFVGGPPSEAALRSFLLKEGFTDAALPPVRRAYFDTAVFIAQEIGSESNGPAGPSPSESLVDRRVEGPSNMPAQPLPTYLSSSNRAPAVIPIVATGKPRMAWVDKRILLEGGVIESAEDADDVISYLSALKPLLRVSVTAPAAIPAIDEDGEDKT